MGSLLLAPCRPPHTEHVLWAVWSQGTKRGNVRMPSASFPSQQPAKVPLFSLSKEPRALLWDSNHMTEHQSEENSPATTSQCPTAAITNYHQLGKSKEHKLCRMVKSGWESKDLLCFPYSIFSSVSYESSLPLPTATMPFSQWESLAGSLRRLYLSTNQTPHST